jgi:hypothetical protein
MPAALDLISKGIVLITEAFGGTAFSIAGLGTVPDGQWNDLGQTETLLLNGRQISFSVVAEFRRAIFPTATTAELLALAGTIVTRDGKEFRIVGEVAVDELTVRFPLDSRHK